MLETIFYDPLGDTAPQRSAKVFCDTTIPYQKGERPWVIFMLGGGWQSDSLPGNVSPSGDGVLSELYSLGFCVITAGYTAYDTSIQGLGLFDTQNWKSNGSGLVIDETKLDRRHSELDTVNLIQHIRYFGINSVPDLDRRPGRGGIIARSAGTINASWVAFGPDRADPNASNKRFSTSTSIEWTLGDQYISSINAYDKQQNIAVKHYPKATGGLATKLNQVRPVIVAAGSPLFYYTTPTRCYLKSVGSLILPNGPHDYFGMEDVFIMPSQTHAPDHVEAMRKLIQPITKNSNPRDVFTNQPDTEEDQANWIVNVVGLKKQRRGKGWFYNLDH